MGMDKKDELKTLSTWMIALGWLLFLAVLWFAFYSYFERRDHPNRGVELRLNSGADLLELWADPQGHYQVPGSINDQPVTFLIDTGATRVSVPAHLGGALGLRPGAEQVATTANGDVVVRATRIDRLALGPFLLRDVAAHLNPGMADDEVLLGMSALKRFDFTQRGSRLMLRIPAPDADGEH